MWQRVYDVSPQLNLYTISSVWFLDDCILYSEIVTEQIA